MLWLKMDSEESFDIEFSLLVLTGLIDGDMFFEISGELASLEFSKQAVELEVDFLLTESLEVAMVMFEATWLTWGEPMIELSIELIIANKVVAPHYCHLSLPIIVSV